MQTDQMWGKCHSDKGLQSPGKGSRNSQETETRQGVGPGAKRHVLAGKGHTLSPGSGDGEQVWSVEVLLG